MKRILIIDDDRALGRSLQLNLSTHGFDAEVAVTGTDGLTALKTGIFDLLFLDLTLPDMTGLDILKICRKSHTNLPVIVISGRQDMDATISAIKFGAFDYIRKPFDMDAILLVMTKVKKASGVTEAPTADTVPTQVPFSSRELIGSTPEMLDILKQIGLLSRNRVSVLILGESGTGKELAAHALHAATAPDDPFVAINCSSVVPTLLESELFGHEKGAFTGADRQKTGKLEAAGEGTVFFDEIGDMSLDLQAKLLRVLQENEFERVGSLKTIVFRARPVFATHRDLDGMVAEGTFRKDLYYRIAVARLELPALRKRPDDIPVLSRHLLKKIAASQKITMPTLTADTLKKLQGYHWPGNVRELENVLTRAAAMSFTGTITPEDLQFEERKETKPEIGSADAIKPLSEIEKTYITQALNAAGWNISLTARQLEISPTTLRKKIADYGLR